MCNKIRCFAGALCLVALGVCASANAQTAQIDQMNTVLDMIGIDSHIALINERKRLEDALKTDGEDETNQVAVIAQRQADQEVDDEAAKSLIVEKAPEVVEDTVELIGIFGLEHELYADVLVNDSRVRFKQGSSRAERQNASFPYRLKFIAPPCAKLINEGKEVSVCLGGEG